MKYVVKRIINLFPGRFLFAGLNGNNLGKEEDDREVINILARYREIKREQNAIVIETALPITESDKKSVRDMLGAPENTLVVEKLSPALVNSLQIIYQGQIYSFQSDNRLEKVKKNFIHIK